MAEETDRIHQEARRRTARQNPDCVDRQGRTHKDGTPTSLRASGGKTAWAREAKRKQAVQKRIEGKKQRRERNHRLFLWLELLIEAGLVDTKNRRAML
ncbi:hypothetical protein AB2G49_25810 (plasmid) [Escherichia coli]